MEKITLRLHRNYSGYQLISTILFLFFVFQSIKTNAATIVYYYQGGDPAVRANWNTVLGGGGSTPLNFTAANQEFNFRKNGAITTCPTANWTQNWTVSGAGSGVTIGDGGVNGFTLTIPSGFTLTGNLSRVDALGQLTITNNTNNKPTLTSCVFDAASAVVYNNSASTTIQLPSGNTYGILTLAGTGGAGTTYTMNGALTIAALNITTNIGVLMNNTATNRIFNITDYTQTNGTLDGGSANTGDANFTAYIDIAGDFTKTGGTIDNSSPGQYTCFEFTGNTAQNFSTAGTDNYLFVNVTGTSSLTLNSNMTLNGSSTQAKTTFTLAATATVNAGSRVITNGSSSASTNLVNGYFITSNTAGFSGGAATAISSSNAPTITLGTGSTIEYNSASAQVVTARTDYANVVLSNNSTKTPAGACTFSGDLTINSTSTFAAGNVTHVIKGDFMNSGTFTSGTGTIHFNGSGSNQNIGPAGGSVTTFSTLRINNASGVTLLQDANVSSTLTLSNGLLNTSSAGNGLLTMQNGSTAPALTSASASYVNGPMRYQVIASLANVAVNFPIGKSPDCRPLVLTLNHTDGTQYNYTAESFNSPATYLAYTLPATVDTVSGVHYWTINRTDNSGANVPATGLNGNQKIQIYFGTNDYVYQGANLTIVKNTSVASTTWFDIGGTSAIGNNPAPVAGSVTSTSAPSTFTSFSTFTLGSRTTGWNSLPVDLLDFSAVANNSRVDLVWHTATEINCRNFSIERSGNGKDFTEIKIVNTKAPGGNSTKKIEYKESDMAPLKGISYYRLKQNDNNGQFKYFTIISVSFDQSGTISFSIFPNPNKGYFKIDLSGMENNHEMQVVLVSSQGKQVYSRIFDSEDILNTDGLDIQPDGGLEKGTYFCSLITEGVKYTLPFLVE